MSCTDGLEARPKQPQTDCCTEKCGKPVMNRITNCSGRLSSRILASGVKTQSFHGSMSAEQSKCQRALCALLLLTVVKEDVIVGHASWIPS